MTALLDVEHLTVRFLTEEGPVLAVDDVSMNVGAGEILGVVGESGCGKSVTAMSIPRLLPPNARVAGSIRLAGRELTTLAEKDMRQIRGRAVTVVFQEPMTSLNPAFTVGWQVAEVVRRHQQLPRRAAMRRAVELFDLVGIPAPERRVGEYPHQLSGGMRQRVMIAIAVACSPALLIADEPTTALDVTIQAGILDVMRDLRDQLGTAIMLITHDLGVVADIADRVVVMYAGRRVEEAAATELFAAPQHPYTVGLLNAIPRTVVGAAVAETGRVRLAEIPGRVPVLREPLAQCTFHPRCPRADERCRTGRPFAAEQRPGHLAACFNPGPVWP